MCYTGYENDTQTKRIEFVKRVNPTEENNIVINNIE